MSYLIEFLENLYENLIEIFSILFFINDLYYYFIFLTIAIRYLAYINKKYGININRKMYSY